MTTFTFAVTGMHCASCGILIDETLEDEVPGVRRAETSVRKGQTIVHTDAGIDPAVLAEAIASAGYPGHVGGDVMNTETVATKRPILWRLGPAAVWLLLAGATAWVLAFNPTDRLADPAGPCLWHALTGINGPTCGGTRMFWYLIHGNIVEAARHHLAALTGMLYGLYALVAWTAVAYTARRLPLWRPGPKTIAIYIGLFLLYAVVLRNLPWPPFAWFNIPNLT